MGWLKPKAAVLEKRQPVVTTVMYENPTEDSGKETVLWKPLNNLRSDQAVPTELAEAARKHSETILRNVTAEQRETNRGLYLAARGLKTTHGMVHVQRAGLQSAAQHGIFHTPMGVILDAEEDVSTQRKGYRVAITARITRPEAVDQVRAYLEKDQYQMVLGPDGNWTLPSL